MTPTVQLAPVARLPGQVFSVRLNGGAAERPSEPAAGPLPLVTVTVCAALDWPRTTFPKLKLDGLTLSTGGCNPVPESATVCGCARVISLTVRVPVCAPVAMGAKTTVIVQLAPGPSVAVHLSLSVNSPFTGCGITIEVRSEERR